MIIQKMAVSANTVSFLLRLNSCVIITKNVLTKFWICIKRADRSHIFDTFANTNKVQQVAYPTFV